MPRYTRLMIGYGLFLFVCGFLGWAATGFESKAKTAIASGSVTGAIMVTMGWLSARPRPAARTAGLWLGMAFAALFSLVFTWRGLVGWGLWPDAEPKPMVAALISFMAVVSYTMVGTLLVMRTGPGEGGERNAGAD